MVQAVRDLPGYATCCSLIRQNFVQTSHFSEIFNWHGTWYKLRATIFLFLPIAGVLRLESMV